MDSLISLLQIKADSLDEPRKLTASTSRMDQALGRLNFNGCKVSDIDSDTVIIKVKSAAQATVITYDQSKVLNSLSEIHGSPLTKLRTIII